MNEHPVRRKIRLMLVAAFLLTLTTFPALGVKAAGPTPYGGTPWAVPGTIQAENYDEGGEGLGYHDTTAGNAGGAYRSDSVDIENSSEGGANLGWTVAGEWLNYSINVPTAGTYDISVRVASNGNGGTFHFNLDQNNISGALTVPNTGGWQNWTTITKTGVYFSAGAHLLGLGMDSNGATGSVGNFNWFQIGGGTPTGPVCFYADINYGGASFCSGAGTYTSVPNGWNDRVSSVKVQSGYSAELFADGNLSGTRVVLTANQPWLGNNSFNDVMSSYRISTVDNGSFWGDTSNIPAARNVLTVKILNRTNGKYPDSQVYWSFNGQTRSIAEQQYIDMPANSAGRMYFYLGSPNSQYTDFIEFTVGPDVFNGNTTRVDWFGIKLAMRLHAHDGYDRAVGEDQATFQEDRAVTFQKFINEVPAQFDHLAQIKAPYMIPAPGKMGDTAFTPGGQYANYFSSYAASVGVNNASVFDIMACAGPLANNAQLCAALNRHVAHLSAADQRNPANFYQTGPANYYAKFWHDHSIEKLAYGFPYDDYAEQSSFVSHGDPEYLIVAVGW